MGRAIRKRVSGRRGPEGSGDDARTGGPDATGSGAAHAARATLDAWEDHVDALAAGRTRPDRAAPA